MVFANLSSIKNDMASITAGGGGSFTNLNSSLPPPTRPPNPQSNASTANAITSSSNRVTLPKYEKNDP
ncbi:unnamed protein product, partial [Rotaria magnacalcarata]